jgi:cytochrome c oxidase assembly protein subunit 11
MTIDQRIVSKNRRTAIALVGVIGGMVALTGASVPLYRLFCKLTGYGGTTQEANAAPVEAGTETLTVRFDANVAAGMPWEFSAPRPIKVRLDESAVVAFAAKNLASEPILGSATSNVTPFSAGPFFTKIQCFCFTEQLLMPGEVKGFPVTFVVDPKIAEDPETRDVQTITLSYTFFNMGRDARDRYLREHNVAAGLNGTGDSLTNLSGSRSVANE